MWTIFHYTCVFMYEIDWKKIKVEENGTLKKKKHAQDENTMLLF